ncbi:MAG: ABC transporter permease [Planctomycetaceae bacterium]|nr:ABC transporter permease [Planctomycetaceae bacterium]
MNSFRLIIGSLRHYWRTNIAVVLGIVAATAVIGGALVVGDSVRDSLRQMSLDRLGGVDAALSGPRFFRERLAEELADQYSDLEVSAPAIVLPGSMTRSADGVMQRSGHVEVYGIDERFWSLMRAPDLAAPSDDDVILNRKLADALQAAVGDRVSLVLEIPKAIPRDSLLGDRTETVTELTLTVSGIVEDDTTPGRFGLNPAQQLPANAFVSLDSLQEQIGLAHRPASRRNPTEKAARINALFFGRPERSAPLDITDAGHTGFLNRELANHITLEDLALRLVTNEKHGYVSLESEQMILDSETARAAMTAATELRLIQSPVIVYLLNELWNPNDSDKFSMYSVAAGVDFPTSPPFGPFEYVAGGPPDPAAYSLGGPIPAVINEWLAADLGTGVGDVFASRYHQVGDRGELPELERQFIITGIVKLSGSADDRGFTPFVEGITDADSFADWRQPFPMKLDRVTTRDEDYWDEYRTTPKVFLARETAEALWRSRYGSLTSVRIAPTDGTPLSDVAKKYEERLLMLMSGRAVLDSGSRANRSGRASRRIIDGETVQVVTVPGLYDKMSLATTGLVIAPPSGLLFQPVKVQGLSAAQGTTDFTGLFIGFSFFLIAAAMLLIGLLFRLGIERRVSELGLLRAVGLAPRQVRRLFLCEGAILTVVGGVLGGLAAVGYAALMIYGLKTWWYGAIGTKFLFLSVRPASLVMGFLIASAVALLAVWWSVRQTRGVSTRELLAGTSEPRLDAIGKQQRGRRSGVASLIAWGLASALLIGTMSGIVPQTEAFGGFNWRVVTFFVVGVAALVGSLTALAWWLDVDRAAAVRGQGSGAMVRLGLRNAGRNRGRSVLTASLIAAATFVIVAVAAGRRNPAVEQPVKNSGNGGFTLVAETSVPVLYDLNTEEGRAKAGMDLVGIDSGKRDVVEQMRVMPFRVKPGENASCLNIYQTQLPTILGVPPDVLQTMRDDDRFKFADTRVEQPWDLLDSQLPDGRIPVLGDMNTLLYSLHKGIGDLIHVAPSATPGGTLQIEGMLDGSVFQGVLLMSESNFFRLFPDQAGFRYFLIEADPAQADALSSLLETQLADYGFDAERVADRLASFLAVQNTYLSTFQTLGGLGLLLGTLGLSTVMLRNVLERRGEIALLRAVGFRAGHVRWLVLAENALLMLWGLGAGTLAALLAMTPHLSSTGADVPWAGLRVLLAGVFAVGMLAALGAVREAVRTPILSTLRAE